MVQFPQSLLKWGAPDFKRAITDEIQALSTRELPLQQGLRNGSVALGDDIQAMILNVQESDTSIRVKAGIFYKSIIAGCSCADDPTPTDVVNEHCEVMIAIDKGSGAATITLLPE
ncbi:hypothetical protein Ga0123462_0132 [Mariprofundus ferrinatatus]|jgi:hypothetical protein|uniref:Uncharacterized protein n=1 Tax=Mariprofundus ferrinatatus TaxID=1921087 RepID=A0A2K8L120_9PROT|nr:hypothetical protein [Mariprofundus ferrinatatus]ATX81010.1 hypothetical protein Ga0123462_0132 [Mariprofundus ferrinatatus]